MTDSGFSTTFSEQLKNDIYQHFYKHLVSPPVYIAAITTISILFICSVLLGLLYYFKRKPSKSTIATPNTQLLPQQKAFHPKPIASYSTSIAIDNPSNSAMHTNYEPLSISSMRNINHKMYAGATSMYSFNNGYRTEIDSMGAIKVPADRLWGAQTQRSLQNFDIGLPEECMPIPIIRAFGIIKRCAAVVNMKQNILNADIAHAIVAAAQEVADGKHDIEFPLTVYQTGSGTQTNMNANEVIANRAAQILDGDGGSKYRVHPNDDCNKSQSSNDTFSSVMHISVAIEVNKSLLPSLKYLYKNLRAKSFWDIIKIGRTHLMDATPLTLGQEFSAYAKQIELGISRVTNTLPNIYKLAQGATADYTQLPFITSDTKDIYIYIYYNL